jgi:riboflavin biosynthesis pyrimidine reductase
MSLRAELMDRMRSMHDAILVGVNTLIMDDPRLQSKLETKGEQN